MTCGMKGSILYLLPRTPFSRTARTVLAGLLCALLTCPGAGAQVPNLAPGSRVAEAELRRRGAAAYFSTESLPDSIVRLVRGRSWREGCPVALADLRYVRCLHRNAAGAAVVGEMVLHRRVAKGVEGLLRRLFDAGYPIERMVLVDRYGADDERSMAANNSSGFNFRTVAGSKRVSKHGLGLAVDINPLYNPCVKRGRDGRLRVQPAAGSRYADRSRRSPYSVRPGDLCCRLFAELGFQWGGNWRRTKDYQHFEAR